jgi:hypothetical protein
MMAPLRLALGALLLGTGPALAGPPYLSDDPDPTDYQHFEIYAFGQGTQTAAGMAGAGGIDFNYGGAPDLQLTAVLPLEYDETGGTGLGNVELAAKYKFLHQEDTGWDVAVFPRVFLPSISSLGDDHAAFMLPFWAQKDVGKWSMFGGGGCVLNRGGGSQDYCFAGWAVTREVADGFRLGAELYHQGADEIGGKVSTTLGFGATYDLDAHHHLLTWYGPGLENAAIVGRHNWYAAMLFTF